MILVEGGKDIGRNDSSSNIFPTGYACPN